MFARIVAMNLYELSRISTFIGIEKRFVVIKGWIGNRSDCL
jgi:hypothetical protein